MVSYVDQVRPRVLPDILKGQVNGKLDPAILAPIPSERPGVTKGFSLVIPAARAYIALHAAARAANVVLKPVSSVDTYRTFDQQVQLFTSHYEVGGPCGGCKTCAGFVKMCKKCNSLGFPLATASCPGESNHGWGLAVDVGTENNPLTVTESVVGPTLTWLEEHAIRFGFGWETVPSEPWHIRYNTGDVIPAAVLEFEEREGIIQPPRRTDRPATDPAVTTDPPITTADPEGDDMPTHRWRPKGLRNEFEIPGCLPVTPAELFSANVSGAVHNEVNPFENLPMIEEFHLHRLLAVIHRNGITPAQIAEGYFLRDDTVELTPDERATYERLGIGV